MSKYTVRVLLSAPLILTAASFANSSQHSRHLDYRLVDEALVIIPVDNPAYADAAANLYLNAAGFDVSPDYANVATLNMPEVVPGGGLNNAVDYGIGLLVESVEDRYGAREFSAADPLYVFGYSQSSVVMGMAEQQLADHGIDPAALHFVMVGDSASAYGGFLNSYLESLPNWLQPWVIDAFEAFGADEILGQVTPDNPFPTDVYSLSGDGWAIYDNGLNNLGLFTDHLEYLGLTPQEVASAALSHVDGLTNYFTIEDSMVDSFAALLTQLQIAGSALF